VLPRLESSLNPAVREALAETAEIARAEEEYWRREVEPLLASVWNDEKRSLQLGALGNLPLALRRRVIRAAAESVGLRLDFQQVEEALEVGSGGVKAAELPWGWRIRRRNEEMLFERSASGDSAQGNPAKNDYAYRLPVPGEISIPEAEIVLEARLVLGNEAEGSAGGDLLDAEAAGGVLAARNWRAGERFWPAHTKAPKKIKELLLEMHVTGSERGFWPVVAKGNEVVWVRGLPTPGHWRPKAGAKEILQIRARPFSRGEKGGQGGI
jgi:tRNA(Ile)-lysidine synthase